MDKIPALNRGEIGLEVGCDGPSLPILTLSIRHPFRKHGLRATYIMLDKEQTQELIIKLQRLQSEM